MFCNRGEQTNSWITNLSLMLLCLSNVSHFWKSVRHFSQKVNPLSKQVNQLSWNRGNTVNHVLFTLSGFVSNVSHFIVFVCAYMAEILAHTVCLSGRMDAQFPMCKQAGCNFLCQLELTWQSIVYWPRFVSRRDAKLTKTKIGESLWKFHSRVRTPLKSPKNDLFGSSLALPV